MHRFDQSKLLNNFDLPMTANEDDALKVLDDRIGMVGCLPCVVFDNSKEFHNYIGKIEL